MSMTAFRRTFLSHTAVGCLVTAILIICLVLVSIRAIRKVVLRMQYQQKKIHRQKISSRDFVEIDTKIGRGVCSDQENQIL